jgi:hypothetical protein
MRLKDRLAAWRERKAHKRYDRERERREAQQDQEAQEGVKGVARQGIGIGTHNP